MNKLKRKRILAFRSLKDWFKALFWAFFILWALKAFVGERFTVISSSMLNTLQQGDVIFVNKVKFGARVTLTPLSVPFCHQHLPFTENTPSYLEWISLPYMRLPGYSEIERNDILVFNYPSDTYYPVDHRTHYIKRCVALPGDTIEIINGNVYVNNTLIKMPKTALNTYLVSVNKKFDLEAKADELGIIEGRNVARNIYELTLTQEQLLHLVNEEGIKSIDKLNSDSTVVLSYIFPFDDYHKWNTDYFGPLIVPKKDSKVAIDSTNYNVYKKIIQQYENYTPFPDTVTTYTFEMDYYFTLGDNRHNSSDSRFWGFVPENHIIGTTNRILFSYSKDNGFNGERFLKLID
jgi:signal peptidase I